jgi:DNA-binding NarL/FixJ family response regulator
MLWRVQPVQHRQSVNLVLNSKEEQAISNHSIVRILQVDDFVPWRRFVINKLGQNPDFRIVGVVSDGLEAVLKAEELQPDLILLDIGLPTISGIEVARRIRKVAPKSKILFLSQLLDRDVARVALSEGGHGYVVKSDAENELLAAVEMVMQGKKFVGGRLGGQEFDDAADSQTRRTIRHEWTIASPAALISTRTRPARSHEVQFYSDDAHFLDRCAGFLGAALMAGNAAVFVGTAPHRSGLLERLHRESPETRAAIRQGRYSGLDAAEFLADVMAKGMPDSTWFQKAASGLITAAAKGSRGEHLRVAACGECAPILWAEGKPDAAIRLEQLWNEISRTFDVDILCGYPSASFRSDEDGHIFRRICGVHSAVHSA